MDELLIPKDLVPPEILNILQKIGQSIRSEADPSALASSSSAPSTLSSSIKKDVDECDDLPASSAHYRHVVHVLSPEVTPQDRQSASQESKVISLFGNHRSSTGLDARDVDAALLTSQETEPAQRSSDVISVFDSRSPSKSDSSVSQNFRQLSSQHQAVSSAQSLCAPSFSQSGQQYLTVSYQNNVINSPAYYHHSGGASSSPSPQLLSPFHAFSGPEGEEERRLLSNGSPCKSTKRREEEAERLVQHQGTPTSSSSSSSSAPTFPSRSPSVSQRSSSTISVPVSASPSQTPSTSRSMTPPSQQSGSHDDDLHRVHPSTPVANKGQRSPKVLTPPETPEKDAKRAVPEVFTFDDLTCTQERFRQTWERLNKLHDQFVPNKRSPSTPRHAGSTPPTPSYRRQEPPLRSPSLRRISPVDQHLLRLEAMAAAASPQSKLKGLEVPSSPATPKQPSSQQRLSADDYLSHRRDSVSPKPKKRLNFDEDCGVSSHILQAQHLRSYETAAAPYPITASPRPSGSGSENAFVFQSYPPPPVDTQPFGRMGPSTPSRTPLTVAEFQKRMVSLASFRDERDGDDGEDERGAFVFSGTRHVYESMELQNRMAAYGGRYTPKRKRTEFRDDGDDAMTTCTCAVMEWNFLQMAECAFKRIRRMDSTPEDFDRFRNELSQTNEILRESMGLMKHIRDICDHGKRSSRW